MRAIKSIDEISFLPLREGGIRIKISLKRKQSQGWPDDPASL